MKKTPYPIESIDKATVYNLQFENDVKWLKLQACLFRHKLHLNLSE